jgi:predicted nucleic-acid-binding Zn-ribbon protein
MQKCPKCGSTRLYHEISVYAKQNVNTGRIYDVNKNNEDGWFEPLYCDKCGWTDQKEVTEKMMNKTHM